MQYQMLAFGQFVFGLPTLAYQTLSRQTAWRHASNSRVGARPARQFLGAGDDAITLSGLLVPEFAGDRLSLDQLRAMGDAGGAWPLVGGDGRVFGQFVLEHVHETGTLQIADGTPRRIEFELQLQRVDDSLTDSVGGNDVDVLLDEATAP
ncbi:phage tail protein [Azohydromonas lata]|uniref:Phage tail protein n=1 Tax=Azohydromonas lata TaxID=45677 RepID=A0ABU5ICY9_9BURK|nr:phage tail protein [Azohydromonas lata]MDZ5456987.1 phage tail protein [Azohydromonas lata]